MDSVTTCLVPFLKNHLLDIKEEDSQFKERLVIKDDLETLITYPKYNLKLPYVKLEKCDVTNLLEGKHQLQPSTSDGETPPLQDGGMDAKTIHLVPFYKSEPSLPCRDEQDCCKSSIAEKVTIQLIPVIKKERLICDDKKNMGQDCGDNIMEKDPIIKPLVPVIKKLAQAWNDKKDLGQENAAYGIISLWEKSSWEQERDRGEFKSFLYNTRYDEREDEITTSLDSSCTDNTTYHNSKLKNRATRPTEYNFLEQENRKKRVVSKDVPGCSWWKSPESRRKEQRHVVDNRPEHMFGKVGRQARRRNTSRSCSHQSMFREDHALDDTLDSEEFLSLVRRRRGKTRRCRLDWSDSDDTSPCLTRNWVISDNMTRCGRVSFTSESEEGRGSSYLIYPSGRRSVRSPSSSRERDTSSESGERNLLEEVNKGGKRRNFCPFCSKLVTNYSRHLVMRHPDQKDVKEYIALDDKSPITRRNLRTAITERIRHLGNRMYNMKIVEGKRKDPFLPARRSSGNKRTVDNATHVCCTHCLGFFRREFLYKHLKNCKQHKDRGDLSRKTKRVLANNATLVVKENVYANESLRREIFPKMPKDSQTVVAQSDSLICKFGSEFRFIHHTTNQVNYCVSKMRSLAQLFITMKKLKPTIRNFRECLYPKNFDILLESVRRMSKFDPATGETKARTLPPRLCNSLKRCASILKSEIIKSEANRQEKTELLCELNDFLHLMDKDWATAVGTIREESRRLKKVTTLRIRTPTTPVRLHTRQTTRSKNSLADSLMESTSETDTTPPKKLHKKKRWSEKEKNVLYETFGQHFLLKFKPSRGEIKTIWENEPILQNRTLQQVVTYVNNITNDKHRIPTPTREKIKNMVKRGTRKLSL